MSWTEFNARTLFPDQTKNALETVGDVANTVGAVAEGIASAIDALSDLLLDVTDPARAAVQGLINALEDMMATGLYCYYDLPDLNRHTTRAFSWADLQRAMDIDGAETARRQEMESRGEPYVPPDVNLEPGYAHGFTGWKARWKDSFDDQGDLGRPIFSEDASVSALLFIAGVPTLDALPALLKALGDLFGIKVWQDLYDRMAITTLSRDAAKGAKEIYLTDTSGFWVDKQLIIGPLSSLAPEFGFARAVDHQAKKITLYDPLGQDFSAGAPVGMTAMSPPFVGGSKAPDWIPNYNYRLSDLPPMRRVQEQIDRVVALLSMADGILALIKELAEALKEKADELRALADEIETLIREIENIYTLAGVYIIKIDSTDGIPGLFDALENEGNPPLPSNSFVAGVCLLAGTADIAGLGDLFGL